MKHPVLTLLLIPAVCSLDAMMRDNTKIAVPPIDLTGATIEQIFDRKKQETIFAAQLTNGNRIQVSRHHAGTDGYSGVHLFTSEQPSGQKWHFGDDLLPTYAHKIWDQCVALYQKQIGSIVLEEAKKKRSSCAIQ